MTDHPLTEGRAWDIYSDAHPVDAIRAAFDAGRAHERAHGHTQKLPTEDGAVIVPAEGHEAITTTDGQEFSRLTFTTKQSIWYGPNLAAKLGDWVIQTTSPSRLTPGTWKVADQ